MRTQVGLIKFYTIEQFRKKDVNTYAHQLVNKTINIITTSIHQGLFSRHYMSYTSSHIMFITTLECCQTHSTAEKTQVQ